MFERTRLEGSASEAARRFDEQPLARDTPHLVTNTRGTLYSRSPNVGTNIVDFGGFDSSVILILRGGILMSVGDSPESLSQAMSAGIMLVGRLGVNLETAEKD